METEKLYCPLDADADNKKIPDSYLRREIMSQEEMAAYADEINEALKKYQLMPDYKESPVQPLHDVGIFVIDKIHSRSISVEEIHGKLWGVATFEITEALTTDETDALKILWEGELSDGFGLDLATTGISIDKGDLYLNFWTHGDDYFIDTEPEFHQRLGRDELLEQIAKKHCRFETLETRNRDSLDFREVSVWGFKAALEEAFHAGAARQRERANTKKEAPAKDTETQREKLFARLDKNLSDYCESLMDADKRELIGMAQQIAATVEAHDYMKTRYEYKPGEIDALLQLQNPLQYVSDHWLVPVSEVFSVHEDISECIHYIGESPEYVRVTDVTSPAATENARDASTEKRSVLEQIREAAKAPKESRPDKPQHNKSGPEL